MITFICILALGIFGFIGFVALLIAFSCEHDWVESKSEVKFDRFLEKGAKGTFVYRKCNKCRKEEAFILEVNGKTHVDIDYAKHYFNLPKG